MVGMLLIHELGHALVMLKMGIEVGPMVTHIYPYNTIKAIRAIRAITAIRVTT